LNGAKRLNDWNDCTGIRFGERSAWLERLEQLNFGTSGTRMSLGRLERSEAVELLERLEWTGVLPGAKRLRINPLMVSPSNHWNVWNKLSLE